MSGFRPRRNRRVLAVASGGGHWIQMLRVMPAFEGWDVAYATVVPSYRQDVPDSRFYTVRQVTRWSRGRLVLTGLHLVWVLLRERPEVVFSTGSAPGLLALILGKLLGARTVWLDSMANVDRLSLSGEKAGRWADLWLTQWPHLARPEGPHYAGATL